MIGKRNELEQFLQWEEANQDTINIKRSYIDLTGDIVAGLLLSRIIYWHAQSKRGKTKWQVSFVDPRNTSRTCPKCGNIDKKNRKSQSKFKCTCCGYVANADINAACNIACRAVVNQPYAVAV
ncbi:MAG: hypothetical protein DDT32_00496 [Syntrophomonadaceae bacterium]|nr:hypothetical protein [Bacillota bacterium]